MLKQDTTKKKRVDENKTELDTNNNNEKYKIETICNSIVYTKKLKSNYLLKFYYLFSWKDYLEKENT